MKTVVAFVFITLQCTRGAIPPFLKNVNCGSYMDYVPIDPQYYRYIPYVVELYRCNGADQISNPQNRKCIPEPDGVKNISISVVNKAQQQLVTLNVQNHTRCKEICLLNSTSCTPYQNLIKSDCLCECKFKKPPNPTPCDRPFVWDNTFCDCLCPHDALVCPQRKEFDKEVCGCVCKQKFNLRCAKRKQYIDETTCGCVDMPVTKNSARSDCQPGVDGGMLTVIMLMEAFLIITSYFLLYVYCYKRKYLTRKRSKNYNVQYYNGDLRSMDGSEDVSRYHEYNPGPFSAQAASKETFTLDESSMSLDNNLDDVDKPFYFSEGESSPLRPKDTESEWYMYDDLKETNESNSDDQMIMPPDYSDITEDEYASVTIV